jgi:hypothetical protein
MKPSQPALIVAMVLILGLACGGGSSAVHLDGGPAVGDGAPVDMGAAADSRADVRSASAGIVSFQVDVPPMFSYCDQSIGIRTSAGTDLTVSVSTCMPSCGQSGDCGPMLCPASGFSTIGSGGTLSGLTWDGSVYTVSTCAATNACIEQTFAEPGRYVAHVCATPGTMVPNGDARPYICRSAGPSDCVDQPFDFPSTDAVDVTLFGADAGTP